MDTVHIYYLYKQPPHGLTIPSPSERLHTTTFALSPPLISRGTTGQDRHEPQSFRFDERRSAHEAAVTCHSRTSADAPRARHLWLGRSLEERRRGARHVSGGWRAGRAYAHQQSERRQAHQCRMSHIGVGDAACAAHQSLLARRSEEFGRR